MKLFLPIFCLIVSLSVSATAQIFSKNNVEKILEREINKRLPQITNGNGKVDVFNFDKLKIRSGNLVMNGKFFLKKERKPYRFKGKLALSLTNPALTTLKLHSPGDNFLFFRRYRSLLQ